MTRTPRENRGRTCPVCGGRKANIYARLCSHCRPAPNASHRLSYTPEYRAWQQMRLRCLDPKHAAYPGYGGRGITVCERWKDSPTTFLADMGPKPSSAHELDRIDNDGNYEPGNCRWVLRKENDRNRRSNRWLTIEGERRTLAEWCERRGLPRDTVRKRLEAGWTAEKALATPIRPKAPSRTRLR